MLVVLIAVVAVTATHLGGGGGSGGCSIAAPVPSLTPQLRSLGGFDAPYDPSNVRTLDALAAQGAGAIAPNLIGSAPTRPVAVAAASDSQPNALVVPLVYARGRSNEGRVAGLVDFLRDCAGRAYFASVDDLSTAAVAPLSFPALSQADAAARLGTQTPQLVYTSSPFSPSWRNPDTGASVAAT